MSFVVEPVSDGHGSQADGFEVVVIVQASVVADLAVARSLRKAALPVIQSAVALVAPVSAFDVHRERRAQKRVRPSRLQRIIVIIPDARPFRTRRGGKVVHDRRLLLLEIAFAQFVEPHAAGIPTGSLVLTGQQEIDVARQRRAAGQVHRAAEPALRMLFGNDVDNAHIALRVVPRRRSRNDFDVLDMPGGNLFERLRTGKHAGLAVHVDRKPAAAAKRQVSLRIHAHRRGILQNIHGRPAAAHDVGRSVHHFFVELVNELFSRGDDLHFGDPVLQRGKVQHAQIDRAGRMFQRDLAGQHVVSYQADHQRISARIDGIQPETALLVRQRLTRRPDVPAGKKVDFGEIDRLSGAGFSQSSRHADRRSGRGRREKSQQQQAKQSHAVRLIGLGQG